MISNHEIVEVEIPYSIGNLKVTALLSTNEPQLAPDYFFDDESFMDFLAIGLAEKVPALLDWQLNDPPITAGIRAQLVNAYRSYNSSLLLSGRTPYLLNHHLSLVSTLDESSVEPLLDCSSSTPALSVAVRLPLQRTEMLPAAKSSSGVVAKHQAQLQIRVSETGSHVTARLRLSRALRRCLSDCRYPSPAATLSAGQPLSQYVSLVTAVVQQGVDTAVCAHAARRSVVAALAASKECRLVDYEQCWYGRAVVVCADAVAEIDLAQYPAARPQLSVTGQGERWRREAALPPPTEGEGARDTVKTILRSVQQMIVEETDSDSMDNLKLD